MQKYYVSATKEGYEALGDYQNTLGITDANPYLESASCGLSTGTFNNQNPPFKIHIDDGQIPRVYAFKIKAEVCGGNTYWTD